MHTFSELPWLNRMRKAGLTGKTSTEVLNEAIKIGSGEALEAAIHGTLQAVGFGLRGLDQEVKHQAFRDIWTCEPLQTANRMLRAIRYEGM